MRLNDYAFITYRKNGAEVTLRVAGHLWPQAMRIAAKHFTDGRGIGRPVEKKGGTPSRN